MARTIPTFDAMLDQLIATPSISSVDPQFDTGNRAVSERLAEWLEAAGFDVRVDVVPGHAEKRNVIARRGSGDGGLVLAGHSDTVPYDADRWRRDPFTARREGDRLFGLGSSDMKSFFAIALEALARSDARQTAPLTVLATADEESGMAGATELVAKGEDLGRYAVIGEPTSLKPVRAHKGIFMLRIIIEGRAAHSSDPSLGRNAIPGALRVVAALEGLRASLADRYRDARFRVPTPTINPGRIAGGDNPNRVCARCELDIDCRLLPGMDLAAAREEIKATARAAVADLDLAVQFRSLFDGVPAMDTPADSAVVRRCEALAGEAAGCVSFATEAPLFAQLGLESVIMGPGDIDVAHQPDEFLSISAAERCVELVARLYGHFCATPA